METVNDDVIGRARALAEKWRYKGEFGTGPWQEGHGPDEEGYILDRCAAELRAALSPADDIDDDRSPFPCWDLGHAVAKRQGAWVCVDCEPVRA